MPLNLNQIQTWLQNMGMHSFTDPAHNSILLPCRGDNGAYQVVIQLQNEGRFLQFRTMLLATCREGHPHLGAVLKVMAESNYQARLLKYGWDHSDGEIVAYADAWIEDGTMTQTQFHRMVGNFLGALDNYHARLSKTLESGKDPGGRDPKSELRDLLGRLGGVPEGLGDLLGALGISTKKDPDDDSV